jgi:predicted dehydrogenase
VAEGIAKVREGLIGRVRYAKSWYLNARPSIGKGKPAAAPDWLNYELWQGPAPRRGYRSNMLHYHWHWWWHWGTGELGNNGVHMLDLIRWGLGADYPAGVSSTGRRYHYDDDQETPDTNTVSFDFGEALVLWEARSCLPRTTIDPPCEVAFFGEKGTLTIKGGGYAAYDRGGKEIAKGAGPGGDGDHLKNFLDSIRGKATLNAEIAEGAKSAQMCHLGNIAWRVGRTLRCDAKTGRIVGDAEAAKLWAREYEKGWAPKV